MTLIGENIHIISPVVKQAIINKNKEFILNLVKKQKDNNISTIDLNIGPAKANLQGSMKWLIETIKDNFDINLSLDTTSIQELKEGFPLLKNPEKCFLNSTSADETRLKNTTDLINEYGANLIALTMHPESGIPKSSDERLELAFSIQSATEELGISNEKLYFDPLILPICVDQNQANVALETIRMIKESFDPEVKTIIGLSNISNGANKELRPLINRVFLTLALGYGLDSAIVDGCDKELITLYEKIKSNNNKDEKYKIYFDLYEMAQNFGNLEDIIYNRENIEEKNVIRTAEILLNKEIYSPSYLGN
ncbi:MAG: methyltetrahydrofolate--corrinoid methyltransferase [Cyanobacteria bacterium SIG30]|nr:methyltetrahydrofolate--corrinoid methyltransferase [Cyanobacteria bacterium SIG30]